MTGPTATADAVIENTQDQAQGLGLVNPIRIGTVLDGLNAEAVQVVMDGDQILQPISANSLVGQLIPGERVYILQIPPAGQYIIGTVRGDNRYLDGVAVDTAGTLVTTSAGTEADISQLQLTVPAWRAGHVYVVEAQIRLTFSVATDGFQITLRQDTALTGTQLATANLTGAATVTTHFLAWPIRPSTDAYNVKLFLSLIRTSGTGTLSALGTPAGTIARTWAGIKTAGARTSRAGGVWRSA